MISPGALSRTCPPTGVRGSYAAQWWTQALVGKLFTRHGFDYVFHLAAYAAEGLNHFIKRFNYTNNLISDMINEAVKHDIECFVFTSSIAVYGPPRPR